MVKKSRRLPYMKIKKQHKIIFYSLGYFRFFLPKGDYSRRIKKLKTYFSENRLRSIQERVEYYCKKGVQRESLSQMTFIRDLRKPKTPKSYYFDAYEHIRHFDDDLPIDFVFGDVTHIPDTPSIVKSRPISDDNQNSILLNLDKARHFVWIKNDRPFAEKKNLLIGRGAVYQEHRYKFYDLYFGHPLCHLAQVNKKGGNPLWYSPKISIQKHLEYKFILSLQGNDVATNLKWIMSSNSIAVMPKPTIETWFMEGKLIGGKHYIEIKEDYSNLEEQLNYYIAHPEKCLEIIKNANEHCTQFYDAKAEELCSLLVLEKYFSGKSS